MMNFFSRFFQKKEKVIKFRDLDNWIENNIDQEFSEIKQIFYNISSLKTKLEKDLDALRSVNIDDEKAENRIKGMVKGNREAYTSAINNFLININIPLETKYPEVKEFSDYIETSLESLNKKTIRNFHIIRELIGKELAEVAKNIKEIDGKSKDLKKKLKLMQETEELLQIIANIHKSIDEKRSTEEKLLVLKKEKNKVIEEMSQLYKQLDVLKSSQKQKDLERDRQERKLTEEKLTEIKSEVFSIFATMNKSLKKYNNMAYIKLIDNYINDPFSTLISDSETEILQHLAEIKKLILTDKMDLRADKKKRSLDIIESFNHQWVLKFKENLIKIIKHKKEIEEKIKTNNIEQDQKAIDDELERKQDKVNEIDNIIEKQKEFNINEKVKEAEEKISKIKSSKIKIENDVD